MIPTVRIIKKKDVSKNHTIFQKKEKLNPSNSHKSTYGIRNERWCLDVESESDNLNMTASM